MNQVKQQYKDILENNLSRMATDMIIDDAGDDPEKFGILADFILTGEEPLPSRAAWVIEGIDTKYPNLITPYLAPLIKKLPHFIHPGTIRNILKIFSRRNIPEKFHGRLLNQCFEWLQDRKMPVAIQVHSMQIIDNLAGSYPEIMQELREVLESLMNSSPPGFISRAKKIIKNNRPPN